MLKMLKQFLLLFTLSTLVFYSKGQDDTSSYSFFVAGHTYGEPNNNTIGLYSPFKEKFNYIKSRAEIKMGFLTGDIVRSPSVEAWNAVDADIENLDLPVYFVAGNHDLYNRPLFESRYGKTNYSFTYKGDLFIILDGNKNGWSIKGDQMNFLKATLDSNIENSDNIFVFFHTVLWYSETNSFRHVVPNSLQHRKLPLNFWTEVVPLFSIHPNKTYMFAGDVGAAGNLSVSYDSYANIKLISSGMGGTAEDNFLVVNVDSSKAIKYDLICLNNLDINCLGQLEDHLVVDSLSSRDQLVEKEARFKVYPNPTSDYVIINSTVEQYFSIKIINSHGKILLSKNQSTNNERVALNYPKGIYFLEISSKNNVKYFKIIKN